jgi:DNA replication protein DnaC
MTHNALLDSYLKRLRLSTVSKNYQRLAQDATASKVSHLDFITSLLELEVTNRDQNAHKERLRRAGFPTTKMLDSFDFSALPHINKSLVLELHRGSYFAESFNIIFMGSIGTGKTHLATSLGVEACKMGKTVKFYTVAALATELLEAHDARKLSKLKATLRKTDLLILDELGMVPFHQDAANLLFQVINDRYEQHSTIITTNLPFPDWTQLFGTQQLTAALLDRLTHRCHILEMNGESYRFKESLGRQKKKSAA